MLKGFDIASIMAGCQETRTLSWLVGKLSFLLMVAFGMATHTVSLTVYQKAIRNTGCPKFNEILRAIKLTILNFKAWDGKYSSFGNVNCLKIKKTAR